MPYFQATDGTTLHYRDHGDGPPIVLPFLEAPR
jgi:hypothetical protein